MKKCFRVVIEGVFSRSSGLEVRGFFTTRFAIAEDLDEAKQIALRDISCELKKSAPKLLDHLEKVKIEEWDLTSYDEFQDLRGFSFF